MENHFLPIPTASYHETREQNALEGKFFTIELGDEMLKTPFPFRCFSCGYVVFHTNTIPIRFFDTMLKVEDTKRSIDQRCRKCKITYRIT